MNYAVVDVGGTQMIIEPGRFYDVSYIPANPGDIIHFNRVLFFCNDISYRIGSPCLDNCSVKATVLRQINQNKIMVFKFKPKKNNRSKKGHRQRLTRVFIDKIL